jgi:predicted nuclease with TOPRIM domain
MPRKPKPEISAAAAPSAAVVKCPACKSEITANGSTLKAKSGYLADLEETQSDLEELSKEVDKLEAALKAKGLELEQAVSEVKKLREGKSNVEETGKQQQQRGSWW